MENSRALPWKEIKAKHWIVDGKAREEAIE